MCIHNLRVWSFHNLMVYIFIKAHFTDKIVNFVKMAHKKIDKRIYQLIESGVVQKHRTMFVVIGGKASEQVIFLHHLLLKATRGAVKPSKILWCSRKEFRFSNYWKKRLRSIKSKTKAGKFNVASDDPFNSFIVSNNIHNCYYSKTQNVLGNTYEMCVLQDFEALTPNSLAQVIETVEGGGLIIILLQSIKSLNQLYTMNMDVHQRFRTEAHQDVVCRFNERFVLSLASCSRCLVVDDDLNLLPITLQNLNVGIVSQDSLVDDKTNFEILGKSHENMGVEQILINCCKTMDQAKVLGEFMKIVVDKSFYSIISLTAARGRGKSAMLGLAVAGAVAVGYSNIFISSPSPENLSTLFEFIFRGFDALSFVEHSDYTIIRSTDSELNNAIVCVDICRSHRQIIRYIHPIDAHKLSYAELLVIDEAAAIPLSYIKPMLGPYLVFLSSTINGYEGTGRSLSLKLLDQLRVQTTISNTVINRRYKANAEKIDDSMKIKRKLYEFILDEPIRYKPGDNIEEWLTNILCLDATPHISISSNCPKVAECQLYYINRDTLFSYHNASELFLQRLTALYVASHYKNSPNDLQIMSDAPAHHLFCLLGPIKLDCRSVPEILVAIQVCLEGEIKEQIITDGLTRGCRASGDLIPWAVAQQYQDIKFAQLAGARIVRIATHPDYQGMGYGTRAIRLLRQYYEMKIQNIDVHPTKILDKNTYPLSDEKIQPRADLQPLLLKLSERLPERLDYLGVSFGLTESLLKFWKRSNFVLVYLRQTANDITGEHSCIMLSTTNISGSENSNWLKAYWKDFRRRFITLLSYSFISYSSSLALSVLTNNTLSLFNSTVDHRTLNVYFTSSDLKRLEAYGNNIVDYHFIMDLVPSVARFYFLNFMKNTHFSHIQTAILLGVGFQHKTVDKLAEELSLSSSQLLGLFNRIIRKFILYLNGIDNVSQQTDIQKKNRNSKKHIKNLKHFSNEDGNVVTKQLQGDQKTESKQSDGTLDQRTKEWKENSCNFFNDKRSKSSVSRKNDKKRSYPMDETPILQKSSCHKHKRKK